MEDLPITRGKTYINRVVSIYTDLFRKKYGFYPTLPIARFGKSIKDLRVSKTEMQIAALIIVFFNWRGMTDNDSFEEQKLLKVTHNFGWFFSSINQYQAYLQNVYGLDLENKEAVRDFVAKNMVALLKS